ncbi:hypothetical protein E2C01_044042 [Portunus trituberculatus]|uniref:Uncharacterized protein n=1 Tax=Portunus trituberculatus TaxID=210409 RepID=A0A5B7FYC4_PORTR|nr:hypothetical protein [Portunus trituberculatus]
MAGRWEASRGRTKGLNRLKELDLMQASNVLCGEGEERFFHRFSERHTSVIFSVLPPLVWEMRRVHEEMFYSRKERSGGGESVSLARCLAHHVGRTVFVI